MPDCFRAKIDASVKKTLKTKPQLIQISAAWNSREGAPLGRNHYVELEIKKPKANGSSTDAIRQPEALREDDGSHRDGRRQARTDRQSLRRPNVPYASRPNTPSPEQVARQSGRRSGSASKKKNWPSRFAIAPWLPSWSACRLRYQRRLILADGRPTT